MLIKRFVNSWRAVFDLAWGGNGLEYTVWRTFLLTLRASAQSEFSYQRGKWALVPDDPAFEFSLVYFLLIVQTISGQSSGSASSTMRRGFASLCL